METWRGALVNRRRRSPTSSSRNLTWDRSSSTCSPCPGICASSARSESTPADRRDRGTRSGPSCSVSTARAVEWLRTRRGNGPCGSGGSARDREEPRVPDHPVLRSDAPLGDVPTPSKHLEGLDVQEPVRGKSKHQLLDLHRRWEVGAHDRPWFERAAEGLERA